MLTLTAACSDPAPSDEQSTAPETEESPSAPAEEESTPAEEEPSADEESAAEEETSEPEESEEFPSDPLTIKLGSDPADFDPTDVYCKVGGGELRHLIAKTNNRPPLLEVTPGEFAMLKLQKSGAPEKTSSPDGIEYRADGVIFTDAKIGDATLNGALECTEVEGK